MTLIITIIGKNKVVQVSDCRLTLNGEEHDVNAIKAIGVACTAGINNEQTAASGSGNVRVIGRIAGSMGKHHSPNCHSEVLGVVGHESLGFHVSGL